MNSPVTVELTRHPEFPLKENLIYLNHAAIAPWPVRTQAAVARFAEQNVGYGSQFYLQWLAKEAELRQQLQLLLNAASSADIALVKNTSEAISFVAQGLTWAAGDNIVSSNEEFPSNRLPWEALAPLGVELRQANISDATDPEAALFELVDRNTRLLTVSSIQFATGQRLDLEKIGAFCKAHHILFCIDAIQSLGAVEFDVQAYQADFVMADGHKWMLGPEGLGVFYSTPKAREQLRLTQHGWHMMKDIHHYENKPWEVHPSAQRFECGSLNMLGIHALSASLSLLLEVEMNAVEAGVIANRDFLTEVINQDNNYELLSHPHERLKSGIVSFKHKTIPNEQLFKYLQQHEVACAARGQGIRLAPHFYNTKAELAQVAAYLLAFQG